jgi:hypothetical protein
MALSIVHLICLAMKGRREVCVLAPDLWDHQPHTSASRATWSHPRHAHRVPVSMKTDGLHHERTIPRTLTKKMKSYDQRCRGRHSVHGGFAGWTEAVYELRAVAFTTSQSVAINTHPNGRLTPLNKCARSGHALEIWEDCKTLPLREHDQ